MKNTLGAFFNSPKAVGVTSIIVAVAIGTVSYTSMHKQPAYTYATATSGVLTVGSNTSTRDLTLGFVTGGKIGQVIVKAGDKVTRGEVLATLDAENIRGALTQAQASYAAAEANYTKVVSGATGPAIEVAKAALNTATVNLDQATKQQTVAVDNAYRNFLNSTFVAQPTVESTTTKSPTISGTYTKNDQGTITIIAYPTGGNGYFNYSGLVSGTSDINFVTPQSLGNSGLSLLFPAGQQYSGTTWTIAIPNTLASNYLANSNAYQQALQTKTQVIAQAQAAMAQTQASLTALVAAARPEDVAQAKAQVDSALGAVQVAQGAYTNTIITAPGDGTVTTVSITPGQIAIANAPAIELYGTSTQKSVAVMIPRNAVVTRNGLSFVQKKDETTVVERAVTLGDTDGTTVEVLSGLSVGDQVVTH
jgi:HlyD family secretion protein